MVELLADRSHNDFQQRRCFARSRKMPSLIGRKCAAAPGAFPWRELPRDWPTPSQTELLKEILICFPRFLLPASFAQR